MTHPLIRSFGGFLLDTTNGITVTDWGEEILTRTQWADPQFIEGSIFEYQKYVGRIVVMRGTIRGTDSDDIRAKMDAFLIAMTNGEQPLILYTNRQLHCRLDGSIKYNTTPGSINTHHTWQLKLRSPNPFWTETTDNVTTPSGVTVFPATLAFAQNNGGAHAYPLIAITNQTGSTLVGAMTLMNDQLQKVLRIGEFQLNIGVQVVLDFRTRKMTDASGNPFFPATIEGEWWELSGGGATQDLVLTHTFTPAPTLDFFLGFAERNMSP